MNSMSKDAAQTTEPTFDQLWAAEEGTATATPPAQAAAEDGATTGEAATDAAQTGQAEGAGTEQTATATGTQEGATATTDDWLEQLDPTVKERVLAERKASEDRYKALHGKLAPVQRALSQAQDELRQRTPAPQPVPPAATAATESDSFFDSEEWKRYEEDFPGDAKVMRAAMSQRSKAEAARLQALQEQIESLTQQFGATSQVVQDVQLQKEIGTLEQRHPDWREVNNSQEFWDWFDGYRAKQPKGVREAFYDPKNLEAWFKDAEFTSDMIDQFKATGSRVTATAAPAQATQASDSTQTRAPAQAAAPQQTGNARLRMAAAPEVRAAGAPRTAVPLESLTPADQFAALWNADF